MSGSVDEHYTASRHSDDDERGSRAAPSAARRSLSWRAGRPAPRRRGGPSALRALRKSPTHAPGLGSRPRRRAGCRGLHREIRTGPSIRAHGNASSPSVDRSASWALLRNRSSASSTMVTPATAGSAWRWCRAASVGSPRKPSRSVRTDTQSAGPVPVRRTDQ